MKIRALVKEILQNDKIARDNDGILAIEFYRKYFNWTLIEFIVCNIQPQIVRERAFLQGKFPELQGKVWKKRQKFSKIKQHKYRQQEKIEELKKVYWIPKITFNWWLEINELDTRPWYKKLLNFN